MQLQDLLLIDHWLSGTQFTTRGTSATNLVALVSNKLFSVLGTNQIIRTNGTTLGSAGTVNWTTGVTGSISGSVATLGVSASGGGGGAFIPSDSGSGTNNFLWNLNVPDTLTVGQDPILLQSTFNPSFEGHRAAVLQIGDLTTLWEDLDQGVMYFFANLTFEQDIHMSTNSSITWPGFSLSEVDPGGNTLLLDGGIQILQDAGISGLCFANQLETGATTNHVIFASTNSAPAGSSSTPIRWVSVQVNGDTNAYRLPLYR